MKMKVFIMQNVFSGFICVRVCVFGVWAVSTRGYSAIYNWHWQSCMRTLCCMRRTEREQENTMNCSLHSYIKCPHSVNSQHLCLYSVLYLISPRWQRLGRPSVSLVLAFFLAAQSKCGTTNAVIAWAIHRSCCTLQPLQLTVSHTPVF